MSWTYTEEYYKSYTRDTWNESASRYAPIRTNLDQWTAPLVARAAPRPGERVLDVASGDGEPALTIARLVLPGGSVLGVDLSERMVDAARERAKAAAIGGVDFQVMDAEKLTLPDASFDLVTCRFGLQIVTDPDAAIREMLRVLKPGGRLAATVWGPAQRCPALQTLVGPMLEYAEPDETGYLPTPYEMGGDGELVDILAKAGFERAMEDRVTRDFEFPSLEGYFDAVLKGTPLGHSLSEEEPAVQKDVLAKTRENLKRWTRPNGSISAPAEGVVVWASKPR
ncbi:MAG TPA: methyltransferase domain-containing protein [Candidatus Thermoplasmatota archaeon]|nr:methyltransferase domain-containing protein [Candidatus Thermoplasmatota archaeon]